MRIGFTPDEEIGRGADRFNVKEFGAQWAYTADGGTLGELEYENFNAASAKVEVYGRNIHPGSAKNQMVNAQLIAMEFQSMLPVHERPECTAGYEGFALLTDMNGTVEHSQLRYIIRDHDMGKFNRRKALFGEIAAFLNQKYGEGTVELTVNDSYYNMKEKICGDACGGPGKSSHGGSGHYAGNGAYPGRYRWGQAVLCGLALPKPLHRWRKLSRPV